MWLERADRQPRTGLVGQALGRQILLTQVHRVGLGRQGEIEAVVQHEGRTRLPGEGADLTRPCEDATIPVVLGAQLDHRGAARQCGARLGHGIDGPARVVVRQHVQPRVARRGRRSTGGSGGAHVRFRPGSSISRSWIFLRSVLRLMPRIAEARIWLPSVRASTASSSGRSTRSSSVR